MELQAAVSSRKNRVMAFKAVILVLIIVFSAMIACGQSARPTVPGPIESKPTPQPAVWLTLDGYDKQSGTTIQEINLWKDYNKRAAGVAATARDGDKVKLVKREGEGVLIELQNGKQGWVTYYFIKEYK